MSTIKEGQVVKFHTPMKDENPSQQYVVLEINNEVEIPRAKIKALDTGLPFPPISLVSISDLEIVEVGTDDLIGHIAFITKADLSKVLGKIIAVNEKSVDLNLSVNAEGVDTNVEVTIIDKDGLEHSGTLFVN